MNKIVIVDSICGSGKSTYFFNKMNSETEKRFIYITPYLDEVERCIQTCKDRYFVQPKNFGKGKLDSLNNMLKEGRNIASTHALFRLCNEDTLRYLKDMNYTLILDEVMDIVDIIKITKSDTKSLFKNEYIRVDKDTNKVIWIDKEYNGKFNDIKNDIINGDVYFVRESFLLWTFPIKIFKALKETYILTYLFDGQLQRYYYDMYNLNYTYKSVKKVDGLYKLYEYNEIEDLTYIKNLINIYDGNMNNIGKSNSKSNPLSASWYNKQNKNKLDGLDILKRNMINYFQKICKTKSDVNMWTVFQDYKTNCKGKGYTKGFVSCNCRATNEYANKESLAYCINVYNNPMILGFFTDNNVDINQNKFALSELIQWLFRSRLRKGETINLYIPSDRMRLLLTLWLEGVKIDNEI